VTVPRNWLSLFSKVVLKSLSGRLLMACGLCLLLNGVAASQYIARITQIDSQNFPRIRVYVSVTDEQGEPIPDNLPVSLSLYEGGTLVSQEVLSPGWTVSSVLVLDVSGSMKDADKLQKAKEAALKYIELAPAEHKIAVVGFSNTAWTVGTFTDSRETLRSRIRNLSASGSTALQDGIAVALDLLRNRPGRKVIVALTDGIENASSHFPNESGRLQLLAKAKEEECSISTIGLGSDVKDVYLKGFEETKGKYLFSPDARQLQSIFEKTINLLQKERVLEYNTLSPDRDGTVRNLKVQLEVNGGNTTQEKAYVPGGLIPHVRGNHLPYFILLLLLLCAPGAASVAVYTLSVYTFRSRNLERLKPGSPCIGKDDPNSPPGESPFKAGDLVVKCPECVRPYYVRSWRFLRCHCTHGGGGNYCYQKILPGWLRAVLDFLTEKRADEERGRTYLCHCAGDKDGW
jgi:hypothetical protein